MAPTHRQRVLDALAHKDVDKTPTDFAAEPLVWQRLLSHFGCSDRETVLQRLDVDCRVMSYDWNGFLSHPACASPGGPALAWQHVVAPGHWLTGWPTW